MPLEIEVGEGVDFDRRGLAQSHVAQLVLLEVRLDPDAVADQCEHGSASGHVIAGLQLIDLGDDPVLRRAHDSVSEVEARTFERRLRLGERSEEHTSELQSLMRISYAVFCLKKKTQE